jgi:hypothetical protein
MQLIIKYKYPIKECTLFINYQDKEYWRTKLISFCKKNISNRQKKWKKNYAIEICGDGTFLGDLIALFVVHESEYNSLRTDGATYVNP